MKSALAYQGRHRQRLNSSTTSIAPLDALMAGMAQMQEFLMKQKKTLLSLMSRELLIFKIGSIWWSNRWVLWLREHLPGGCR